MLLTTGPLITSLPVNDELLPNGIGEVDRVLPLREDEDIDQLIPTSHESTLIEVGLQSCGPLATGCDIGE